jgi:short-subunit dehydrogenase
MFKTLISLVGIIFIYSKLKSVILYLFNFFYGSKRNLTEIYGKHSYVFITGGSEGLGASLGLGFALRGFNVILVARSKDKLEATKARILAVCPSCKVILVPFDFNNIDKPENLDLEKAIGIDLSVIDISILVNNVGISTDSVMHLRSEADIKQQIKVNCVPMVLLSRYFISRFLKRSSRSAILNVSSILATKVVPFVDVYGATKQFNQQFSASLSGFYPAIDVYTYLPGFMKTNMTPRVRENTMSLDTDSCVRAALCQFGSYRYQFFGHLRHEIEGSLFALIPERIVALFLRIMKRHFFDGEWSSK